MLVIAGHTIQLFLGDECYSNHLWNLFYSFHMPAFFAISGWLAWSINKQPSNEWGGVKRYLKKRGKQLLIPYFAWSFIEFIVQQKYTLERFVFIVYNPDSYYWFLWVLFWICIILKLIQYASIRFKCNDLFLILFTSIVLLIAMVVLNLRCFGFQFIAYYFFFYILGYILHKYDIEISKYPYVSAIILLAWGFLAWNWNMQSLPQWFPVLPILPASLLLFIYRGVTAILAILLLLSYAKKICNEGNRVNLIVCSFGTMSMGVYTFHVLVIEILKVYIDFNESSGNMWIIMLPFFLILTIISYYAVRLISKQTILSKLLLGK